LKAAPGTEVLADLIAGGSGFAIFLALGAAVAFFGKLRPSQAPVAQPLAFNHRLHVEQEGLECSACHPGYLTQVSSGLPTAGACTLCHLDPQGETAEEQRLVNLLQEGASLDWEPLFRQPPHVFFSHRRHAVVAEIECATCHGDIGTSTAPPARRAPLSMERCIACHEAQQASTDCSACHR